MISSVMFISAAALSLLATWLILVCMRAGATSATGTQRNISLLVGVAIICVLIGVLELGFITPTGLALTLSTVSGVTILLLLNLFLLGMWQHGVRGLGLLLLPFVAVLLAMIPFFPRETSAQWVEAHSFLQTGHMLLSVVAYAILTIAALYAAMQLKLDHALKNKQLGFFVQAMPSLADLSNYLFAHVRWVTWLLALSILTGLAWQWTEMHYFALLNHKVLLALFAWVMLLTLNQMRHKASWNYTRASKMVLASYVILVLAYFGVKFIQNINL